MAGLDNGTRKRLRKDLDRLGKKKAKAERKLEVLETKRENGKVPSKKFHDKKAALSQQVKTFDRSLRKIRGKLGKSGVTVE